MKRLMAVCFTLILTLSSMGCGNSHGGEIVFDTENIKSVTFFTPAARDGLIVPQEELTEIVAWLGTFTVGEEAGNVLIPGSNSITVHIEYENGVFVESGLSTTNIENATYYMDCSDAPDCYTELINK